jgi:type I site-specific restriction endonuclease
VPSRQRSRGFGLAGDSGILLEYFSTATQIGLTATPKETKYVSNIDYFGTAVYSYSLKQGIHDGFLASYKMVKVHIDRDVEGYRPEKDQRDREGDEIEDRIYNTGDFDRTLVLDDRTKLVARKVTEFLKESGDRFQKAIVFCVDREHAARMRQALVNENADLVAENHRYVMRSIKRLSQLRSTVKSVRALAGLDFRVGPDNLEPLGLGEAPDCFALGIQPKPRPTLPLGRHPVIRNRLSQWPPPLS